MIRTSNTRFGEDTTDRPKERPTKWKQRLETWKCLCVWPPGAMSTSYFYQKMKGMLDVLELENRKEVTMRRFEQQDKKVRFEMCFASDEDRTRAKNWIDTHLRDWLAKNHTQPELRMRRPIRRRAHNGRFSILTWNANTISNKYRTTSGMLERHRPTIFAIQETMRRCSTWQDPDLPIRMGKYSGFESRIARNSNGRNVRGLAILLDSRANLRMKRLETGVENGMMLFGQVSGFKSGIQIIIGNVYIPNRARRVAIEALSRSMEIIREKFPREEIILVGDWNEGAEALSRRLLRTHHMERVRVLEVRNNATWHRKGKAWSDLDHGVASTNVPQPRGKVVREWGLSDHWPLHLLWKKDLMLRLAEKQRSQERMSAWDIRTMQEAIASHNRFAVLAEMEPDDNYIEELTKAEVEVAKELKCMTGGRREDERCKIPRTECFLDNEGRRWLRKLHKKMKKQAIEVDDEQLEQRHQVIKELKKLVEHCLGKAARLSRSRHMQVFQLSKQYNDTAAQFQWIKGFASGSKEQKGGGTHPLRDRDGHLVTDLDKIAVMWTEHFCKLAEDRSGNSKNPEKWRWIYDEELRQRVVDIEREEGVPLVCRSTNPTEVVWNNTVRDMDLSTRIFERRGKLDEGSLEERARDVVRRRAVLSCLNFSIGADEIVEYLKGSGRRKSPGADKVTNEFLRCAAIGHDPLMETTSMLAKCLEKGIGYCWDKAYIPDRWKDALVTPVPKKGDLTDMNNSRGISLIATKLKLTSGIFAKRLLKCAVGFRMLDPAQAGFISREEAVAQAACLVEILDRRKVKGQETYLCFVDLAKAYDSVPHEGLIAKAERFGIHGKALEWIKAIYKDPRIQCRKADGTPSEAKPYNVGVRQGAPESPILFNIFMDDLLNQGMHELGIDVEVDESVGDGSKREKLAMLLYADDVVCIADSIGQLRKIAERMSEWCNANEMRVNAAKCGVMRIKPFNCDIGADESIELRLQGELVPVVDTYTYLGVQIDERVERKTMVAKRIECAKMATLRYMPLLTSAVVPPEAKFLCLRAVIAPTLTYGGEIWGFSKVRTWKAEQELMRAARICFRLPNSVSRFVIRRECNLRSIYETTAVAKARLTYKVTVLNTWLPKVLSGEIVKHPRNTRKPLPSEVAKRWMSKKKVHETISKEVEKLEEKIRAESVKRRPDWTVIASKRKQIEEIVPTIIRRIMFGSCCWKPNPRSEAETRYDSGFGATHSRLLLMKFGTERTDICYGITVLYRIRAGQYWTAQRLAKVRLIHADFEKHCPFCPVLRVAPPDTVAHWILDCPAWKEDREETLDTISAYGGVGNRGLNETTRKFVCSITAQDPNSMIGIPLDQLGTWMMSWMATSDREWNEEALEMVVRFVGRTAPSRFNRLTFSEPSGGR